MTWQLLLMDANAIVCLLIMVRLMFFRKEGKRHRLSVAVLAYLNNMSRNGFNQVSPGEALPGDVIIRQPFPGADPCHAMILLDDNMVLHHDCSGHLSRRTATVSAVGDTDYSAGTEPAAAAYLIFQIERA